MSYPGGKGGIFQKLINLMPPHEVYIETHLGGGAVIINKRPAKRNIGIDIDPEVTQIHRASSKVTSGAGSKADFFNMDACDFLRAFQFTGKELVYCDPPYLLETRKGGRLYKL